MLAVTSMPQATLHEVPSRWRVRCARHLVCLVLWQLGIKSDCRGI